MPMILVMKVVQTHHGRLSNQEQEHLECSSSLSTGKGRISIQDLLRAYTKIDSNSPFCCISEHLMRRIACESDFEGIGDELVEIYNDGLGKGLMSEKALDAVYEPGSAESLG